MDDFLTDMDRLGILARTARRAPGLDPSIVAGRIVGVIPMPMRDEFPLRLVAGLGAMAASVALVVTAVSFSAWTELADPFTLMGTLPDVASFLRF